MDAKNLCYYFCSIGDSTEIAQKPIVHVLHPMFWMTGRHNILTGSWSGGASFGKSTPFPGSLIMLAQYCFDALAQAGPNVVITQGIAQGIATSGPAWASAPKQYWAKIGATRDFRIAKQYRLNVPSAVHGSDKSVG